MQFRQRLWISAAMALCIVVALMTGYWLTSVRGTMHVHYVSEISRQHEDAGEALALDAARTTAQSTHQLIGGCVRGAGTIVTAIAELGRGRIRMWPQQGAVHGAIEQLVAWSDKAVQIEWRLRRERSTPILPWRIGSRLIEVPSARVIRLPGSSLAARRDSSGRVLVEQLQPNGQSALLFTLPPSAKGVHVPMQATPTACNGRGFAEF
jgi:hypothetical protein